jgi:hypothetical protein
LYHFLKFLDKINISCFYSAKTQNCQINVTGKKQIQSYQNGKITVQRDEQFCYVKVSGEFTFTAGSGNETTLATITTYLPPVALTQIPNYTVDHRVYLNTAGKLAIVNSTSTNKQALWCLFIYPI